MTLFVDIIASASGGALKRAVLGLVSATVVCAGLGGCDEIERDARDPAEKSAEAAREADMANASEPEEWVAAAQAERERRKAAEVARKREEAARVERERQAAEAARKREEAARVERERQAAEAARKREEAARVERERQAAEAARKREAAEQAERERRAAAETEAEPSAPACGAQGSVGAVAFVTAQEQIAFGASDIASASAFPDPLTGGWAVALSLCPDATERFHLFTERHVGETVSLKIDGETVLEPTLLTPIADGELVIDGYGDRTEAEGVAVRLLGG